MSKNAEKKSAIVQKDQVFHETLVKLNQFIEDNYEKEGFLPSENKLTELLGVSRSTLRTVLATFARNSVIISYPKKGHYVLPKRYRVKKIGVVIGDGKESPFIHSGCMTGRLIDLLSEKRIHTQIIQSTYPEKLKWRALAHGVRALIWIQPNANTLPHIKAEKNEVSFPQVVIGGIQSCDKFQGANEFVFARDTLDEKMTKIRFLRERGHRRIVWLSSTEEKKRLREIFKENPDLAFEKFFFVDTGEQWEQQLAELVKNESFTAITTFGPPWITEKIFDILNAIPRDGQPEVLLPTDYMLEYLLYEYPKINIVAHTLFDHHKMAKAAADALVDYIYDNKPIESKLVKAYQIVLLDKS